MIADPALTRFNELSLQHAERGLTGCCGSSHWVTQLVDQRPFSTAEALKAAAHEVFATLAEYDWLEAFEHHPRIGDVSQLRTKFAATAAWASKEQAGASNASDDLLRELASENDAYYKKFGFVFIVCATGKSATEMLALLKARMPHTREEELRIAGEEQLKITDLRIDKLLRELA